MKEYLIIFSGRIKTQANSEEEAENKFENKFIKQIEYLFSKDFYHDDCNVDEVLEIEKD